MKITGIKFKYEPEYYDDIAQLTMTAKTDLGDLLLVMQESDERHEDGLQKQLCVGDYVIFNNLEGIYNDHDSGNCDDEVNTPDLGTVTAGGRKEKLFREDLKKNGKAIVKKWFEEEYQRITKVINRLKGSK